MGKYGTVEAEGGFKGKERAGRAISSVKRIKFTEMCTPVRFIVFLLRFVSMSYLW